MPTEDLATAGTSTIIVNAVDTTTVGDTATIVDAAGIIPVGKEIISMENTGNSNAIFAFLDANNEVVDRGVLRNGSIITLSFIGKDYQRLAINAFGTSVEVLTIR